EVIEVSKELVKAMHGGQKLISVAEMVLAKLTANVAMRFEHVGDGRVFRLKTKFCSRQADLCQAGPNWRLPGNECGSTGGTALLGIPVGEHCTFPGDTVNVGGLVPHDPVVVGADVEPANIISPDDQYVWFLRSHSFNFLYPVHQWSRATK